MSRSAMLSPGRLAVAALAVAAALASATTAYSEEISGGEPASPGRPQGPPLSGPRLDHMTEEVSAVIRCPTCQGLAVRDSPATAAVDMQREIRALLAAGYSAEQVLSTFEQAYGEFIRLEPKAEGLGWLVWLAPFAALAAGGVVVTRRLRVAARHRRHDPSAHGSGLETYSQRARQEVSS